MLVLLPAFAWLLTGPSAAAQPKDPSLTLSLTILSDTDGQPVAGASCLLTDYGIFGIADAEGRVILQKVPAGKATVLIQMLGFEDWKETLDFQKDETLTFRIRESSLALEEVVVTAKPSAAGSSTSSSIGRMAIDHLQATSLKDVMQLLPGALMVSSDMTSEEKLTIRTLSQSTANNAFGTSIMMDGVPVSDKSVEVIRGIPSAEYGDLTSGAVIVNTKAGYTPVEVRTKVNPTTFNTSFGKGWKFGGEAGSLNVHADYARASGDPRVKNRSFDRVNGGLTYSKTIARIWSTTTKLNLSGIVDLRSIDPDLLAEGTETSQKQTTLRLTHNGRISLNKPLSRSLTYAFGLTLSDAESYTSSIVSADGGMPVITSLTDGYSLVPWITASYRAGGGTVSRPLTFYSKIGNVFTAGRGKARQRFNIGAEYRFESNKARGFYNDDDALPLRPNSNGRPRPYFEIPALNQLSAYAEDNFTWSIAGPVECKLQGGVRFDMLQPGLPEQVYSVSPRFNGSLRLAEWITLRGGWGQSNKTPGLAHLYPEPKYTDRVAASYLPADGDPLVVYHTRVTEVERNNSLRNATNSKTELGFDLSFKNGMTASVVAYRDYMKNGFGNFTEYSVYYANYYTSVSGIRMDPAGKAYLDWGHPARVDTVFTTSGRIGNTRASLDRGVEFDINFGQIKAIRTAVILSGAYMETQTWNTGPNYASPSGIPAGSPYALGGANTPPFKLLYPNGLQKDIDRRFSANLRLVCNIPRMKMVISAANQVIFYQYRHTTNLRSDPYAWIDTDLSYHEITPAMLDDPATRIKGILLSAQRRNPADSAPVTQPPIWLMNMRLTTKNFGFSFFVNNAFFYMPYQASSYSGTLTERNTGTFSFGVEMYVKI